MAGAVPDVYGFTRLYSVLYFLLFCETHDLVRAIISVFQKRMKNCIVKIIVNVFKNRSKVDHSL